MDLSCGLLHLHLPLSMSAVAELLVILIIIHECDMVMFSIVYVCVSVWLSVWAPTFESLDLDVVLQISSVFAYDCDAKSAIITVY